RAEMGQPTLPLEFDYTPLQFAANYGQRDLAEVLLRHGANPNACLRAETPLGRAVLMHDEEMVDLLLRKGADPNLAPLNGITPLRAGCTIRTTAQGGVGKMVLLAEMVHRLARRGGRAVYVRWQERFYRPDEASREQMEAGIDSVSELVLGHMQASGAEREHTL